MFVNKNSKKVTESEALVCFAKGSETMEVNEENLNGAIHELEKQRARYKEAGFTQVSSWLY